MSQVPSADEVLEVGGALRMSVAEGNSPVHARATAPPLSPDTLKSVLKATSPTPSPLGVIGRLFTICPIGTSRKSFHERLPGSTTRSPRAITPTFERLANSERPNATSIRLRFRHRYEVDPKYIALLEEHGLVFSGKHPTQPIMRVLELPQETHPYFLGTQAHPELTSRPLRPQPMFMGLIKAAVEFAEAKEAKEKQPQAAV